MKIDDKILTAISVYKKTTDTESLGEKIVELTDKDISIQEEYGLVFHYAEGIEIYNDKSAYNQEIVNKMCGL